MTVFKRLLCIALIALTIFPTGQARAQGAAPLIIRDTEIEKTLKDWISPLLGVSGLGENSVDLVLVQSTQINAFVAGGANIFIYTGLRAFDRYARGLGARVV